MYCEICGNEITRGTAVCRFCGSRQNGGSSNGDPCPLRKQFLHKTVNLEAGMPLLEQALVHLRSAVDEARRLDIQVLTIIHGYGSSGRGGVIRVESRKMLDYMLACKEIRGIIPGEQFNKRNGVVRDLLRRFPDLNRHPNLNKNNKGVTLALMV